MLQVPIGPNLALFTGEAAQIPVQPDTIGTISSLPPGQRFEDLLTDLPPELANYAPPIETQNPPADSIPDLDTLLNQLDAALQGAEPESDPVPDNEASPSPLAGSPQSPAASQPLAIPVITPGFLMPVDAETPLAPEQKAQGLSPSSPFFPGLPAEVPVPFSATLDVEFALEPTGIPDRHTGSMNAPVRATEALSPRMSDAEVPRTDIISTASNAVRRVPDAVSRASILAPKAPERTIATGQETANTQKVFAAPIRGVLVSSPALVTPVSSGPTAAPAGIVAELSTFPPGKTTDPVAPVISEETGTSARQLTPGYSFASGPASIQTGTVPASVSQSGATDGEPKMKVSIRAPSVLESGSSQGAPVQGAQIASSLPAQQEWRSVEISFENTGELRGAATSPGAAQGRQDSVVGRPDLPRHVSRQIVEAVRMSGARQADLHLNPAELGRVKISLQSADGNVTVQIAAERPETLDLMRRNMDLLARDFRESGLGSMTFSFSEQRRGGERGALSEMTVLTGNDASSQDALFAESSSTIALQLGERIDIRL